MTYTAILSLVALGDDLSRLDRTAIISGMPSFTPSVTSHNTKHHHWDAPNESSSCHCVLTSNTLSPPSSLLTGIRALQQPDGSFRGVLSPGECDMRFLYCACAISRLLGDWSGVNRVRAIAFIRSCITYEGGISLVPGRWTPSDCILFLLLSVNSLHCICICVFLCWYIMAIGPPSPPLRVHQAPKPKGDLPIAQ